LIAALVAVPNLNIPGLRGALCDLFGLNLQALLADPGGRPPPPAPPLPSAGSDGGSPQTSKGRGSLENDPAAAIVSVPDQASDTKNPEPPLAALPLPFREGGKGVRSLNVNGDVIA